MMKDSTAKVTSGSSEIAAVKAASRTERGVPQGLELHEGDVRALARHRGEGLPLAEEELVRREDGRAEEDHDKGHDVAVARIEAVEGQEELGGEDLEAHGRPEEGGDGEGAHAAREDEEEGREHGGHHDGEGDPEEDLGPARLEYGRGLLEVGVHVPQIPMRM